MKRSALVAPGLMLAVAAVVVSAVGPFAPQRVEAQPDPTFEATFETEGDFYDNFDYGYSGQNPWDWGNGSGQGAITSFHGDHDMSCQGPTTDRTVEFGGDRAKLDYEQLFWHCAPGNDPAKGHLMTGVDTVSYNIAWFSPKKLFTGTSKVCWDQNFTHMSNRKWTQVVFVTADDAARYPAVRDEWDNKTVAARGSGGVDLGFTAPDFRAMGGPSTGIHPEDENAGLKLGSNGAAGWWQNDDFTGPDGGDLTEIGAELGDDKATRYPQCVENQPGNQVLITQESPAGTRTALATGQIPQGPVRVVFQDDNYDPPKDEQYDSAVLTWHWDNITVVATASEDPPPPPEAPPSPDPVAPSPEESAAAATATGGGSGPGGRTTLVVGLGLIVLVVAGLVLFALLRPRRVAGEHDPTDPTPPLPDY